MRCGRFTLPPRRASTARSPRSAAPRRCFSVGAVLFARGYLGGGDVKLLSAATLWAGPAGTPELLMLTGVLGGALALFLLMPFGTQIAAAARGMLGQPPIDTGRGLAMPVPYGVAIAGAALIVTLHPYFG